METRKKYPSRVSVEEIMEDMGLGRNVVYEMLQKGIIPNMRMGKRFVVVRFAYEEWKKSVGQHRTNTDNLGLDSTYVA